jgi:hypothetical protein
MKQDYINSVAHLNAQSAAWFLLCMLGVIILAGWLEWRRG